MPSCEEIVGGESSRRTSGFKRHKACQTFSEFGVAGEMSSLIADKQKVAPRCAIAWPERGTSRAQQARSITNTGMGNCARNTPAGALGIFSSNRPHDTR